MILSATMRQQKDRTPLVLVLYNVNAMISSIMSAQVMDGAVVWYGYGGLPQPYYMGVLHYIQSVRLEKNRYVSWEEKKCNPQM